MKTTHTPGPWHRGSITFLDNDKGVDIGAADGSNVAIALAGDNVGSNDVARANARLIAAAPVLLEALRSARSGIAQVRASLLDSVETHRTQGGWLDREAERLMAEEDSIAAAIAKAEGA